MASPIDQLRAALESDSAAQARQLLNENPELKSQLDEPLFAFDTPAIVNAAGAGKREIVDVLLDAGADINARSRWWAGSFGVLDHSSPQMAAYLIERGATIDAHAASRLGLFGKLKELISANPELVHARGGDGKMPLHFASSVEIAAYLLDRGAEIDARDVDHESTAAQYLVGEHPEVVRYLVARGCQTDILMAAALGDCDLIRKHLDADPGSIRTQVNEEYFPKRDPRAGGVIYIWVLGQNRQAHQIARRFGHEEALKLLIERSPNDLRLNAAIAVGDEAAIQALLAANAPRDARQVAIAAQDNDARAVGLMLQYGWPVHPANCTSPLHWAAWHGNTEMLTAILKYNPPLEEADPAYHAPPLGWAIHASEHGWHVNTGDYAGVVEALLAAGAKAPPKIGGTAAVREVLRRHGVE